jgi:hypothetical protein
MERFLSQALFSMAAAVAAIILVATAVVFLGVALSSKNHHFPVDFFG